MAALFPPAALLSAATSQLCLTFVLAALPTPPSSKLAKRDFQFIISSLLPIFPAACSAGVYFLNCMNNLQLLIQQIYPCSYCVADPKFPSSDDFLLQFTVC